MAKVSLVLLPNPLLSDPKMYVNLGVLYIGAVLKQSGHDVGIVDLRIEDDITEDTAKLIPESDFVGFSATTGEIKYAKQANGFVKKAYPKTVTIIGGAHASLLPQDCSEFDAVVMGEGERTILDIVENGDRGVLRSTRIKDLDSIPFPEWDLLPERDIFSETLMPGEKYGTGRRAMTIISSRGCPFCCSFCANIMKAPVIFRSPQDVYEEVKILRNRYGVYDLRFEDDNFTLKKKWFLELCSLLEPLGIRYKCHSRAELITPKLVRAAKRSGCVEMAMGVESGDDKVLKKNNKRDSAKAYYRAIPIIKQAGLISKIYLMAALPGETEEAVENTKKLMRIAQPDKWTLSVFIPYPGCPVWRNPKAYDINILNYNFEDYWNFPERVNHEFTDGTSSEELYARYKDLYGWLRDEDNWKTDSSVSQRGAVCYG